MEKGEIKKAGWCDQGASLWISDDSFVFISTFNNFGSVLLEAAVGQKTAFKKFDWVGSPLHEVKERGGGGEGAPAVYLFLLYHHALKRHNWLQPRRKLCHCHKGPAGCSMLLSAGSNPASTFWPGVAAGRWGLLGFWRQTFYSLQAAVTLHARHCIAHGPGGKVGPAFRATASCGWFENFLNEVDLYGCISHSCLEDRVVLNESKCESFAS